MTTQQAKTIRDINAKDEAQRFQAAQAAREQAELDVVALYYAVQVKIAEGRIEEARAMWLDYKKGK